jgi:hypothetical protein
LPKKTSEIALLPPTRVPLAAAEYDEAVSLLAELLLDAAEAKRWDGGSCGVIDGASHGVIDSVILLPQRRRKGRDAA